MIIFTGIIKGHMDYPHPSFPGPNGPLIGEIVNAKKKFINRMISSYEYQKNIVSKMPVVLYNCKRDEGRSLIGGIDDYSLLAYEELWSEMSEAVKRDLGSRFGEISFIKRN